MLELGVLYFFIFFLGASIGSFINVVAQRWLTDRSPWHGRSVCPKCHKVIRPWNLIPVFSYLFLRGRCADCREKISLRYWVVEVLFGVIFVYLAWSAGNFFALSSLSFWRDLFFITVLSLTLLTDAQDKKIFMWAVRPFCLLFPLLNYFSLNGVNWQTWFWLTLIGGAVGYGFFALQYYLSRGKWLGAGDMELGLLLGLMFGWPEIWTVLIIAYIVASIYSLLMIVLKKKRLADEVPLGVFLCGVAIVMILFVY